MIYSIWLSSPPLLALIISFWLIANSNKRNLLKNNFCLSVFLIGIIGLNIIELFTYTGIAIPSLFLMKSYYIFMIITLSSILILSIKISNLPQILRFFSEIIILVITVGSIYSGVILFTDFIIADFKYTSYSITRIPGEFYFLIQILFLFLAFPILGFLTIGSSWKNVNDNVKRSRVILCSFSPLLISLLVVLGLMELGVQVNATLVLPIGTTFLLLMIINTERKQDLFKLLIKIPYTKENLSFKQITNEIENFLTLTRCGYQSSLKDLTSTVEQHIVNMAVEISNGSQVRAAELLNTSTSSICRKKRH